MEWVTAFRFKNLHVDPRGIRSKTGPVVGVRKEALEPVEVLDDRTLRFCISTGSVDRDLDLISVDGWQLDHFQKNPVVLWAHQAQALPIGKALDVSNRGDRLSAVVQFLPATGYGAASEFAEQVYGLARDGFLSATSVGFRPLRWDFTTDTARGAEDWWPGIDYHEQELVELSLCTVPANPEALIEPLLPEVTPPIVDLAALEAARAKRRRALLLAEAHASSHAFR